MLIIGPLVSTFVFPMAVSRGACTYDRTHTVPPFRIIALHFLGCVLIREAMFYYLHRFLHRPEWYERVHKFHHRWTAPISIAALYATPFEHVLTNVLPVIIPIALLKCHLIVSVLFLSNAILATLQDHGGYKIPYYYDFMRHNKHHEL